MCRLGAWRVQVLQAARAQVIIVLRGWADDKIEADWSDDEMDEFCISPLRGRRA